jgi:hypothetical protein
MERGILRKISCFSKTLSITFVLIFLALNSFACDQNKAEKNKKLCPGNFVVQPENVSETNQGVVEGDTSVGENLKVSKIILLSTKKACPCTMKRCKNGEGVIKEVSKNYPDALSIENVDFEEQKEEAMKLIKKHKAIMLPVILFLDDKDNLLLKVEGEFSKEDITSAYAKYFKEE